MPILVGNGPLPPPSWWMLLTENQRSIVIARLRKLGVAATNVDTTTWPK
jgi:hypothetical protein